VTSKSDWEKRAVTQEKSEKREKTEK